MAHTPNWFEYEWAAAMPPYMPYKVLVDEALCDVSTDRREVLLTLRFASKRKNANALNGIERSMIKLHTNKLYNEIPSCFAGTIEKGAELSVYLYVKELTAKEIALKKLKSCMLLDVKINATEESNWATYHKLLYPDTAKRQTVKNGKQLKLMAAHGNIKAPRRVEFVLFFRTEGIMMQFAEEARLAGFAVGNPHYNDEADLAYGVGLLCISELKKPEIDALTTKAIRIAENYGGKFSYWEAPNR